MAFHIYSNGATPVFKTFSDIGAGCCMNILSFCFKT